MWKYEREQGKNWISSFGKDFNIAKAKTAFAA